LRMTGIAGDMHQSFSRERHGHPRYCYERALDQRVTKSPQWKRRPCPAPGRQYTARSVQGSGVLQRIGDGEAFRPRRYQ
jgi:hypothetical protein